MNRTVVFVTFACVVIFSLVGIALIVLFRPDATATMLNAVTILMATLSGFAVTAYGLGKLNEKVEKQTTEVAEVKQQTNGRLTRLASRNAQLVRVLIEQGIDIPGEEKGHEHL
jgi:hypothetical protein